MLENLTVLRRPLLALLLVILLRLITLNIRRFRGLFRQPAPALRFVITTCTSVMVRYGLRRKDPATDRTAQDLNVIEFNCSNFCEQVQSPFFSVLPGEIRDRIFAYTLAEFEDTSAAFDNNSCYRRPEYAAPRHSDTALLRTCQRIYQEAFFYPFALAEQILWLAWSSRRPSTVTTVERLQPSLVLMQKLHGDTELNSVRVFAQLCHLESGGALSNILEMPHFLPRSMTVTIRHTDIWSWETDNPIYIGGHWTEICRFPNSLRCLNVQVESLERKKDQIDYIVSQMIEKWRFTRRDETTLQADPNSASISRWSGSSTWEGVRWIRDESRPETLDYYVATVPFRPVADSEVRPRLNQGDPQLGPMPRAVPIQNSRPYVAESELREASVPPGLSADEVLTHFDEYRRQQLTAETAQATEAARMRMERQQNTRLTRQAVRRARAQVEIATAYPHHGSAGGQQSLHPQSMPVIVSADTLRAARAARRLARRNGGPDSTSADIIGGVNWFDRDEDDENVSVEDLEQTNEGLGGHVSGKRKRQSENGSSYADVQMASGSDPALATDLDPDVAVNNADAGEMSSPGLV